MLLVLETKLKNKGAYSRVSNSKDLTSKLFCWMV